MTSGLLSPAASVFFGLFIRLASPGDSERRGRAYWGLWSGEPGGSRWDVFIPHGEPELRLVLATRHDLRRARDCFLRSLELICPAHPAADEHHRRSQKERPAT